MFQLLNPSPFHLLNIHVGHSTCPRSQKYVLKLVHWSIGPDGCNITMINLSKSELKRVINIEKTKHLFYQSNYHNIVLHQVFFSSSLNWQKYVQHIAVNSSFRGIEIQGVFWQFLMYIVKKHPVCFHNQQAFILFGMQETPSVVVAVYEVRVLVLVVVSQYNRNFPCLPSEEVASSIPEIRSSCAASSSSMSAEVLSASMLPVMPRASSRIALFFLPQEVTAELAILV